MTNEAHHHVTDMRRIIIIQNYQPFNLVFMVRSHLETFVEILQILQAIVKIHAFKGCNSRGTFCQMILQRLVMEICRFLNLTESDLLHHSCEAAYAILHQHFCF